jgi:uncharacterized protein YeaO (DUF488 family)
MIKIKRIYETPEEKDGFRILVDRLWPRGISKEKTHVDLWLKEIAPSNKLRKWFSHDPKKWIGFKSKYTKELENNPLLHRIKQLEKENKVLTLLYSAKDKEHNNVLVLYEFLSH